MKLRLPALCVLLLALHGCNDDADNSSADPGNTAPAPMTPTSFAFDSALVRIETAADTHQVRVEVAERDEQRAFGLMERTSLAEDAGMVFLYNEPQPATSGYWMYRTRIPLDIAFFDGAGRIVAILQMEPCPSPDPEQCRIAASSYSPGKPYSGALEVNRGYFARNGVQVGDRLTVVRRQ